MRADALSPLSGPDRGFTLIETMTVVALLAVLAGLAAPSFVDAIQRQRLRQTTADLVAALQLARIEAQRTGQHIVMRRVEPCPTAHQNGEWRCGWTLFVDTDRNQVWDSQKEPALHHGSPNASTWILRRGLATQAAYIDIDRFGGLPVGLSLAVQAQGSAAGSGLSICGARNRLRVVDSGAC